MALSQRDSPVARLGTAGRGPVVRIRVLRLPAHARRTLSPAGASPGSLSALAGVVFLISLWCFAPLAYATSRARIVVPDVACLSGEEVFLGAYLVQDGLKGFFKPQIPAEALRFADSRGKVLDSRLTDPSGLARVAFQASGAGEFTFTVTLEENPRFRAEPAAGRVFILEKKRPLFFVSVEAGLTAGVSSPALTEELSKTEPLANSLEKTRQIARRATLVYLTHRPLTLCAPARDWLDQKHFPSGALLSLSPSLGALTGGADLKTSIFDTLWKDHRQPACLVTGVATLASQAAAKGLRVYLLRTPGLAQPEAEHNDQDLKNVTRVEGWDQVPSACPFAPKDRKNTAHDG